MAKLPNNIEYLSLPNGKKLDGAFIWPDFAKDANIDVVKLWKGLLEVPIWPSDKDILFDKFGNNPHWIEGSHPALNYRGNAIKRHKIWCQSEYKEGMRKYAYTGWRAKHPGFIRLVLQV